MGCLVFIYGEGAWKVHGRCVEGAQEVAGRCTEGVWKVHGRCVEGAREDIPFYTLCFNLFFICALSQL